ncbi:MFS transporter [Microvirga brassicacearum]|uniref:MFS transporter n=2 Tax=Microvirga brassicacearum TaxID=2580413 RepID=A0A5N3P4H9_9HYPH|nr:MFS transporter [Microvirga brassicacearum]
MIGFGGASCDEGVIRAAVRDTPGCAEHAKPWVLAATILGSSMAFIDGSVVTVALPAIQAELTASTSAMQWVVNAYMLFLGALILVGGAVGDRFGRRRIFVLGIVVFTAASMACGLAPNATALIAARGLQGVGGALLVPSSLAIISAAFPEDERGRAIGTWAGFSALTTALGPVLGGWLVDTLSWRAIFFINLPLALVTLGLAFWRVPESRDESNQAAVDWRGGLLATLGLAGLAYGLTAASDRGWSDPAVLSALVAGALVLAVFIRSEAHAPSPLVPLRLFRSRTFSGANGMTLLLYFALGGALFFLPFNLIQIQGYSATLAGAAFLPSTLIMGGLSRWSGGLVERYGAWGPLTIGPGIAAVGFALLAVPGIGGSYWTTFFPAMTVLGLGMAISVAPLTTTVMGAVADRYAGTASGINNAVSRIAGMLAVALLGTVAVGVFGAALDQRLDALQVPPELRQALRNEVPKLAEAKVPPEIGNAERETLSRALDESFVRSFRIVMLVTSGLALGSALCAGLTISRNRQGSVKRS